nr:integrase, catalytic region, zinc finger, CCHC-type, peptidase aspartic, catalytic [Tanacetum cinerariifolium]
MWSDQEKKIQKIERLARSLLIQELPNDIYSLIDSTKTAKDLWDALARHMLGYRKAAFLYECETFKATKGELFLDTYIQYLKVINDLKKCGLPNDIYSLIDSNKTAKDLWDAFARYMLGSEYGEQDRKDAVLYEYETFKANEGELLLDTYIRYLQVINDLKKFGYSKDNLKRKLNSKGSKADDFSELKKITALLAKAFNRRKFYSKPTNNNLRKSSTSQSANKKQEFVKTDDKKVEKKADDINIDALYNILKQNQGDVLKEQLQVKHVVIDTHAEYLDTFSSVKRPKNSGVNWKKKWLSNTSNGGLSVVSVSNLNKNVKRYSRKDLLACNNSQLGETSSSYMCNDAMNVSCNSRMNDLLDDNNFFIFDDENVKISPVSKMPFKKKPRDSMHIVQICLWIIDSRFSKHMMSNRALLTNFVEKFLEMVRFGNNDFAMIAGYGDVVIGSMTIKKVYYVEGLRHNLFSVRQFCDKGLEVAFRKSTCFVRNEDGVDLLTGDRSLNLYTISLNEVASNSSTCLLAKASSSQSWLWHQRLFHLNFNTINNLVKNNLVQDEASEVIISFIKKTQVNLQLQVQQVRTDNGTEFKNNNLAKFFDEIMNSSTMNVETSLNEEVFHEVSESFQGESSSSSLNDDVQQSLEEVILPQTNTQSISNNMIPNGDEASTSHNVFNERLEDAYFDASTLFHDPSNVHNFYQPYPYEKKWTKDHPFHKIIGDPKSSVRTR